MRAACMVMGSIVVRDPARHSVSVLLHSDGLAARFASFVARNSPDFHQPAVGETARPS